MKYDHDKPILTIYSTRTCVIHLVSGQWPATCVCCHGKVWAEGAKYERFFGQACEECAEGQCAEGQQSMAAYDDRVYGKGV